MQLRKTLRNIIFKFVSILEISMILIPFVLFAFIALLLFYSILSTTVQSDPLLEAILKAIFAKFQNSVIFNALVLILILLIFGRIFQKYKRHIIALFFEIPKHENKLFI